MLSKSKSICAPYSDLKKSCVRFCRKLRFAYLKKARKCKVKDKRRFSELFFPCMKKCAVVKRAARVARKNGVPFGGAVKLTDRLGRDRHITTRKPKAHVGTAVIMGHTVLPAVAPSGGARGGRSLFSLTRCVITK